jgi:expansin (peptidoglycan-binding protein)
MSNITSRIVVVSVGLVLGVLACSEDSATSGGGDTSPIVDTSGGGPVEPVGGQDVPADEVSGAVQDQVCSRTVPESVSPAIDCTPKAIGPDYDGCSEANDACGSVIGCILGRNESIEEQVEVSYSGAVEGFKPPATLLPAMGTLMDGMGTGWFGRGDGTVAAGSCTLPPVRNIMAAALTTKQFGNADWCGACAEVVGSSGQRVRVQIVDQCAGCSENSLDLGAGSDSPYEMLETTQSHDVCLPYGGQPIRWRVVPCETVGGVVVHYVPGFNRYTPAVQIRNHRLPIVKLEDKVGGQWEEIAREAHNQYYLRSEGDGAARPIELRVTAIDGSTIQGVLPPYEEDLDVEVNAQF